MKLSGGGTQFLHTPAASEQVLPASDIARLARLGLRVFDALGHGEQPQDIEWAFDGERFFVVQARPLTQLPRFTVSGLRGQPDIWSNANFRDALPMVQKALVWSLNRTSLSDLLLAIVRASGYSVPHGLETVRLFEGRAYLNMSLQQWLYYDSIGLSPHDVNTALGGHQPTIDFDPGKQTMALRLAKTVRFLRLLGTLQEIRRRVPAFIARIDAFCAEMHQEDWAKLSDWDIAQRLLVFGVKATAFGREFGLVGFGSGAYSRLVATLQRYFPGRGTALAGALMIGAGDITSATQGYRLMALCEVARDDPAAGRFLDLEPFDPLAWESELPDDSPFKRGLSHFLAEFGHRGVYEVDISNPRWQEDPSYLLNAVRSTYKTADLTQVRDGQKKRNALARREVASRVPWFGRWQVHYWLHQAVAGARLREAGKSMVIKPLAVSRAIFLEVGHRLAERGILAEPTDIFHCAWSDVLPLLLGEWDGQGLAYLVRERRLQHDSLEERRPPDLIIDEAPQMVAAQLSPNDKVLQGIGAAAGRASGPAAIIASPLQGAKLQNGDVLVAPSTDPAWTPLFLRASALVMETGGVVSHGAIVAREYGIPAVVNVAGVLGVLVDGQDVTVDGDQGQVYW